MKGPARLRSLSELPSGLSSALDAAPSGPSEAELLSLAAKVGGAVGVPLAAPPALVIAGKSTTSVLAAKPLGSVLAWMLGGMVLGAGLSGASMSWTSTSDKPAPAVRVKSPRAPRVIPPAVIEQPSDTEPEAPRPVPATARALSRGPEVPVVETPALVAPPEPEVRSELELLREARRALERDPARTLELCAEHARSHAIGVLEQERDVLQIDALLRLGRLPEARARFESFERTYPHSAHTPRLRGQLEEKSTANATRTSK
ncbi:MAG TPA: hypothetical protein VFQ61_20635 [Polyangiaceae bacterium]|nr:hypothetical protein [Polyangiaceae bacterium]